ncbi:hypothetical protein [Deinococcus radiotolerans]|nr:hypothetical protein [Deinococcus radiotolerans]
MRKVILTVALSLGLAWAASAAVRVVDVLDAGGQVVATGALSGHLRVSGALGSARTVRVSWVVGGVTKVQEFTLAGPITARELEAERLSVSVAGRVLPLEAALEPALEIGPGRGTDDGAGHDAGDDRGGVPGGRGADDGAGHDAGDDHGGTSGGHGGDDGSGHDGGDDHGGSGGGGDEHGSGHH